MNSFYRAINQKPTYPGERLGEKHIRLVKLHSGDWSSDIRCSLSSTQLGRHPEYVALSYVWGSQRVKRTIWINDQEFKVTINLESALRHIRHVQRGKDILLWIDAICIDQGDVLERTHQVGMMGNIYRSCKRVIVYLGDKLGSRRHAGHSSRPPQIQEFSEHRLEGSKRIEASLKGSTFGGDYTGPKYGSAKVFAFLQSIAFSDHFPSTVVDSTPLFEALRQMMHSPWTPWWSRIWVVQEVALPPEVVIMYGANIAPWKMFAMAASNYMLHSQSCCALHVGSLPRDQRKVLDDFSTRVRDIEELRGNSPGEFFPGLLLNADKVGVGHVFLLHLLKKFRHRKATDSRDKVYALLGIVERTFGKSFISPDYTLSESQTFEKLTIEMIRATKSFSIWGADLTRKFRHDLPSWVVDWDAPGNFNNTSRANAIELYSCRLDESWQSIQHIEYSLLESNGRRLLKLHGLNLVRIEEVYDVMWTDDAEGSRATLHNWRSALAEHSNLQFWKIICADVICREPGGQEISLNRRTQPQDIIFFLFWALFSPRSPYKGEGKDIEEFHRDCLAYGFDIEHYLSFLEADIEGSPNAKDYEAWEVARRAVAGKCWNEHSESFATRLTNLLFKYLRRKDAGTKCKVKDLIREFPSEFINPMDISITSATLSRRLFKTFGGHYGLAPADAKANDSVFLFPGANTPFILRSIGPDDARSLVGDCYLHGFMDNFSETDLEKFRYPLFGFANII